MSSMKKLAVALGACGLLAAAVPAFALPSLKFQDSGGTWHTVDPFGGLDWASNATAWSTALVYDNTTIATTTYLATAAKVKFQGGADATNGASSTSGSSYEFTIKATINETATCLSHFSGIYSSVCRVAEFYATGGSFDIYFDQNNDSNILTGAGFTNGTKIISGTIEADSNPAGSFTADQTAGVPNGSGKGDFAFNSQVTYTRTGGGLVYFNPELDTSNGVATLQLGTRTTDWTPPTGYPGAVNWGDGGNICALAAGCVTFQADGNQTFTATVPEPGSLALVGLSLMGLSLTRSRRST